MNLLTTQGPHYKIRMRTDRDLMLSTENLENLLHLLNT